MNKNRYFKDHAKVVVDPPRYAILLNPNLEQYINLKLTIKSCMIKDTDIIYNTEEFPDIWFNQSYLINGD